ncbi:hypothetical protein D9Q98_006235 [Chlorella vulgaris]|uniref:tRNA(Ile)-lysidine synthetase n=1 Tax=Chlorella vulgaris TaxID=3077 RepID=A0A9D4TX51_CHLVU|nr:hypothetical protein D9Q98_006235 [Chlorella vulgaris]
MGGVPTLSRYVSAFRNCGLRPSDRLAVALSGGPDSMALASMTLRWQGVVKSEQAPLALIVDHKMRPESTEEAQAVAEQAAQLGMRTSVLTIDWSPDALAQGDRMVAAREARYAALLRACGEQGCGHLLLGHHAGDQAETFLLRLLHASGVAGLACMPAVAQKRTECGVVQVVRPLLSFHKAELEQYCRASGLRFVLDPTNSHLAYHRNRIRHALHEYPRSPALSGGDTVGEAGPSFTHGRGDSQAAVQWGAPMASLPTTLSEEVQEGDSKASRSSSSASRSSSSASRSSSNSDSSHGSGHSQSIVSDLLMLQRRCQAYAAQEQKDTQRLLQRAVLRSSCSQLQQQSMQDEDSAQHPQALQQAQRERPVTRFKRERGLDHLARQRVWAQSRPWFIDWHVRLDQVAHVLQPLPFALLAAGHFGRERAPHQNQVALSALSRILQAVSGSKYPPPLAHALQLRQMLRPGHMGGTFTGGGCLVRRLPRCKGRFVLCIPVDQLRTAEQLLRQLPPINAFEEARQRAKAAAQAEAAAGFQGGEADAQGQL